MATSAGCFSEKGDGEKIAKGNVEESLSMSEAGCEAGREKDNSGLGTE